jgi:ATP-binding cassette, subfamily B, bacterial
VQEPRQFAKFSAEIAGTLHLGMHTAVATGVFNGALAGFSTLVFTAIIYFGVHQVADGGMTVGVLTSFLLYAMSVNDALSSLAGLYSHLMKAIGATERVFELLDREPAMKPSGGKRLSDLQGRIEFRDVAFAYQSRPDTKVLNGASFVIEPGQVVALVGLSGAGKSTCVSLIERFYDPQQGDVFIDGVDAKDLDLSWLRANIGVRFLRGCSDAVAVDAVAACAVGEPRPRVVLHLHRGKYRVRGAKWGRM